MVFEDRRDAGRQLAAQLSGFAREHPVVIALPRGGVPVAAEVARALRAPLDVLAVRKIGAPANPEFGVGAVAEDGTGVLDPALASRTGMTRKTFQATLERESRELLRRVERYRDGRAPIDVRGRTVIVVDDGIATGLTDLAAIRAVRGRGADRIILAVPVGARESIAALAAEADEVVCHTIPSELRAVGHWYRDFSPVSDEEVLGVLAAAGTPPPRHPSAPVTDSRELTLELDGVSLAGDLTIPPRATGLVVFAHGSGSSRLSARNRAVAHELNAAGLATLLFDLLSEREGRDRNLVFDIPLLAGRLEAVTRWVLEHPETRGLPVGYFGASTGAAAALRAAAEVGDRVAAVVSRGGRPDLAADRLPRVTAPTLLIVGGADPEVLELNRRAAALLRCSHRLVVVPGAGHLFAEPGALETVAGLAVDWFAGNLTAAESPLAAVES